MPVVYRVKGPDGPEERFITRNRACRKLQLTLSDFKRVCILKGVYPQVPSRPYAGTRTAYYLRQDITCLERDPLLAQIRARRTQERKARRREARAELLEARLIRARMPVVTLDHVILERYPTFEAALSDLDDALSLVCFYAALSTGAAGSAEASAVSAAMIRNCQRLAREWDAFVAGTGALVRAFVSTRGYYYQAVVRGVRITWLAPHALHVELPATVDAGVLRSFAEFHQALLGFVLFRLYRTLLGGFDYPPHFGAGPDGEGAGDHVLPVVRHLRAHIAEARIDVAEVLGRIPDERAGDPLRTKPFAGQRHLVSREVPRSPLELVLLSGGADVVPFAENAAYSTTAGAESAGAAGPVTHCIVDRPPQHVLRILGAVPGRVYVQPQWCFDSLNWATPLPPAEYAPGQLLPPHVSPFAADTDIDGGYVPDRVTELDALAGRNRGEGGEGEEKEGGEREEKEERREREAVAGAALSAAGAALRGESAEGVAEALASALRAARTESIRAELGKAAPESPSESESSDIHERFLYAETPAERAARRLSDADRLRASLLSRKKARIYERLVEENAALAARRTALEARRDALRQRLDEERAKIACNVVFVATDTPGAGVADADAAH
ncbi:Pescadillo cell cycle regulator [Giardia muris]|uniref:Pescadillo homolog n=1 Tax=Giardia muris TaxID=5742 RepID=A0A4Z1T0X5_GIAMU|nr:Pescadillo cell cycle regulator [Giardia muris]|eukprot:TNJ26567.1 Pescadillo cell cycle regulator [Giardia muris]